MGVFVYTTLVELVDKFGRMKQTQEPKHRQNTEAASVVHNSSWRSLMQWLFVILFTFTIIQSDALRYGLHSTQKRRAYYIEWLLHAWEYHFVCIFCSCCWFCQHFFSIYLMVYMSFFFRSTPSAAVLLSAAAAASVLLLVHSRMKCSIFIYNTAKVENAYHPETGAVNIIHSSHDIKHIQRILILQCAELY